MSRHRVVVIGAGFGGLAVSRGLRRAAVDVTLIDAHNFHTFQPLLYQVATAGLDADDVAYAVRGIFRRQRSVDVRMGRVVAIDVQQRSVRRPTVRRFPTTLWWWRRARSPRRTACRAWISSRST